MRVDDVDLHVGAAGPIQGPDLLLLTGGPGCVQYLERADLGPPGFRCWYPEPRGVGRSGGGPHTIERAIADLEAIRVAVGVDAWTVLGHSWGSDLAVRYAVEHPGPVTAVVGIAGRGPQRDRLWSEAYESGRPTEPVVEIEWDEGVHAALAHSFTEWTQHPDLWRRLADCDVPIHLIAAGDDIRPAWPAEQLARLVRHGRFSVVPDVPHDLWATHPEVWAQTVRDAVADAVRR
ncbi:alpha/beta fold hydrolase [Nocardioides sp. GXZ039]|uniref:alpha/beta fold hydrolase n=1 Tax=Nocardioides sp. GXZ039 TaxID=3136018 RepID=UPI0030F39F5E